MSDKFLVIAEGINGESLEGFHDTLAQAGHHVKSLIEHEGWRPDDLTVYRAILLKVTVDVETKASVKIR